VIIQWAEAKKNNILRKVYREKQYTRAMDKGHARAMNKRRARAMDKKHARSNRRETDG